MVPWSRAEHAQLWRCKSCLRKDGTPWRNWGTSKACGKCGIHKGACFKDTVPSNSLAPSRRRKGAAGGGGDGGSGAGSGDAMRKRIAELEAQLARARDGTARDAMDLEFDGDAAPLPERAAEQRRECLQWLERQGAYCDAPGQRGDPFDQESRPKFAQERDELRRTLAASKPLDVRQRDLATRMSKQRQRITACDLEVAGLKEKLAAITADLNVATRAAAEARTLLVQLEADNLALAAQAPLAPEAVTLDAVVPRLEVTMQQVSSLLRGLGGSETIEANFQSALASHVAGLRAAQAESQRAAPGTPQGPARGAPGGPPGEPPGAGAGEHATPGAAPSTPGSFDVLGATATAEDVRSFVESMGFRVPAEEAESVTIERARVKNEAIQSRAMRLKTQAGVAAPLTVVSATSSSVCLPRRYHDGAQHDGQRDRPLRGGRRRGRVYGPVRRGTSCSRGAWGPAAPGGCRCRRAAARRLAEHGGAAQRSW